MRVSEEKHFTRLTIEYNNTKDSDEKEKIIAYLDERFGKTGYRIIRSGPVSEGPIVNGLMIVDAEATEQKFSK